MTIFDVVKVLTSTPVALVKLKLAGIASIARVVTVKAALWSPIVKVMVLGAANALAAVALTVTVCPLVTEPLAVV